MYQALALVPIVAATTGLSLALGVLLLAWVSSWPLTGSFFDFVHAAVQSALSGIISTNAIDIGVAASVSMLFLAILAYFGVVGFGLGITLWGWIIDKHTAVETARPEARLAEARQRRAEEAVAPPTRRTEAVVKGGIVIREAADDVD